jgi:ABC-2 type transport system ATP-binding protein
MELDKDILLATLRTNPASVYKTLCELSNVYALNSEYRSEIIKFGSCVSEYLENTFVQAENKDETIYSIGSVLIEKIVNNTFNEKSLVESDDKYQIKNYFLSQRPEHEQKTIFSCENISKRISSRFSISNFSFDLKLGEITGIVGENGNGKTTLLRMIAGELKHDRGNIVYPALDKKNSLDWSDIKRNIGYVKQNITSWKGISSVERQLKFMASLKGFKKEENQRVFDFIIQRLSLHNDYKKLWDELSGGYKLRFELAKQLIWGPKLLILDEPLANLDIKTQAMFLTDLRALANSISNSMAIIISSQNIYEIEKIADRIIFMKDGQPFFNGSVHDIGQQNDSRCYQIDTELDTWQLQNILDDIGIIEIRDDLFYKLIFTDKNVSSDQLLKILSVKGIRVSYFRDITNSARILFER